MTAGDSKAALTITPQPALAPSPQPRPAPTARALPPGLVAQVGQNWTPIVGQNWMPIDKRLHLVHLCLPSFAVREHRATPSETPPTPFPHRANSDAAMTRRADRRPGTAHACAIRRTTRRHPT